ncbi:hypothetical protein [Thermococcus sp. AM4]|uniref:hypothetical protein n=1 Tax=Thermococcus sp. (strain AM4) TaxID=246969 RepID=UPI0001870CD3|nr:hypothetical protein [Thermococcus sp. AM4]EEB74345.1 conserved hypothetical protein [Thermococcus sp. AM4]
MVDLGILRYYIYAVAPLQVLVFIVTYRKVREAWEKLPAMSWKTISFLLGLLAILVASIMEFPFLISNSLAGFFLLGIFVGPIEEFSKLLPVKLYREEKWKLWKKTIGAAFFFGLIEGSLYALILLIVGEHLMALYRVFLVAFHVALTFVTVTHYLVKESWSGYLRASLYHSLYDLPLLVFVGGYRGPYLKALMGLGLLMVALLIVDVLRTAPLVEELIPREEEEVKELPLPSPVAVDEELTSSP